MSLFRNLGRRAERLKRQVDEAAAETYECVDCGERFSADYKTCPECGSDRVESVE